MNAEAWNEDKHGGYFTETEHVSSTQMKCFNNSQLEYKGVYVTKTIPPPKPSFAMDLGSGAHVALWELPDLPTKVFNAGIKLDGRTKDGKQQLVDQTAAAGGRILLWDGAYQDMMGMRESILRHREGKRLVEMEAEWDEFGLRWQDKESGLWCKSKVDRMRFDWIVDLKTMNRATFREFEKSGLSSGKHIQAAHYIEGHVDLLDFGKPKFFWIVVHSSAPYEVVVIRAGHDVIEEGLATRKRILAGIKKARVTTIWEPEGYHDVQVWNLPPWMTQRESSAEPMDTLAAFGG